MFQNKMYSQRASDDRTKNIAGGIPKTTRSTKVTILTHLMHIPHNYTKHFETAKILENFLTKTDTQPDKINFCDCSGKKQLIKEPVI